MKMKCCHVNDGVNTPRLCQKAEAGAIRVLASMSNAILFADSDKSLNVIRKRR